MDRKGRGSHSLNFGRIRQNKKKRAKAITEKAEGMATFCFFLSKTASPETGQNNDGVARGRASVPYVRDMQAFKEQGRPAK